MGRLARIHYFIPFLIALLVFWDCSNPDGKEKEGAHLLDTTQLDAPSEEALLKAHRIDSLLRRSNKRGVFNGAALIAEKGKVIYQGAFGFSHFRTKDSLHLDHAFQLASVSKVFTAAAIMVLKEEGLLEYDQKVMSILPDFLYDTITVRHLLNHRSGLPRYMFLADKFTDRLTPISNQDMVELFCEPRPSLFFTPGRSFNYLNTNYAFLACIVEEVSGMKFADFLKKKIFDPLGMEHTVVFNAVDSTVVPNETSGHKGNRRRQIRGVDYYINGVVGDKGVYSTVGDLFLFDRALYEGKLFEKETLEEAYTPGTNKIRRDNRYYGFGWRITSYKDHPLIYHNGWWMGYKTSFSRFIEDETTIILLTNTDRKLAVLPQIKALLYPGGEEPVAEEPF